MLRKMILLLTFLLFFSGCNEKSTDKKSSEDVPKTAVELLFEGLEENDPEKVRSAVESGADVNALNPHPAFGQAEPALNWGYIWANFDIIRFLIEQGADIDSRDLHGKTLLMDASYWGRQEQVEYLVSQGADVNAVAEDGTTAVMSAAAAEFQPMVFPSEGRESTAIVKYLMSKGADIHAHDEYETTALMKAAWMGNLETMQFLISQGADLKKTDIDGNTALLIAAGSRRYRALTNAEIQQFRKIELALGDNSITDIYMEQIEKLGDSSLQGKLEQLECIKYLVSLGVDTDHKNNQEYTAQTLAVKKENLLIAEYLDSLK